MPNNLSSQSFNEFADSALDAWHQSSGSGDSYYPDASDSAPDEGLAGGGNCPCGKPEVKNMSSRVVGQHILSTTYPKTVTEWDISTKTFKRKVVTMKKTCLIIVNDCFYVAKNVGPCCPCPDKECVEAPI